MLSQTVPKDDLLSLKQGFWPLAAWPLSFAFLFSGFVNLLQLAAPLYMLQIYDRVLPSGSEPTLLALSLIMAFLFLCMGVLDHLRGRILLRIGLAWQIRLQARVLQATLDHLALRPSDRAGHRALSDLEGLAQLWGSPAVLAALDMPFAPIFLLALYGLHPILGSFALCAMAALFALTLAQHHLGRKAALRAELAQIAALRCSEDLRAKSDVIRAFGMGAAAIKQWQQLTLPAQRLRLEQADRAARYGNASKSLRFFLQSAILGLGAWLVLRHELAASAMIAGSILLGRALAPIEVAISQWGGLAGARQAAKRLEGLLSQNPATHLPLPPPRPRAQLEVQELCLRAEDASREILKGISFALQGGQVLGVVGPNGSGKTTLLRALSGQYPLHSGKIRLGDSEIDHHPAALLGQYIGYLPQEPIFFGVNIAQNIAKLDPKPNPEALFKAARAAKAHEMILRLEQGYDSQSAALSGGQLQRIALARALYSEPLMLLLDEPDANLDHEGAQALVSAIRASKAGGGMVVLTAHRPNLLAECDLLLMLHEGRMLAFGPRDHLLRAPCPPEVAS